MNVREYQAALNAAGFGPLVVDGIRGPKTTHAVKMFQRSAGLMADGIVGPKTTAALNAARPTLGSVPKVVGGKGSDDGTMPPWMAELHRLMGLHESKDKSELTIFLKEGDFLGDPTKLPWCGDAVESAFAKTMPGEKLPDNPFFAQNWKTFGQAVSLPIVGAVGVIRWSASAGHVGFIAGATKTRVYMLGGNQSNAITVAGFPRSKFIAYRWPNGYPVKSYPAIQGSSFADADMAGTR